MELERNRIGNGDGVLDGLRRDRALAERLFSGDFEHQGVRMEGVMRDAFSRLTAVDGKNEIDAVMRKFTDSAVRIYRGCYEVLNAYMHGMRPHDSGWEDACGLFDSLLMAATGKACDERGRVTLYGTQLIELVGLVIMYYEMNPGLITQAATNDIDRLVEWVFRRGVKPVDIANSNRLKMDNESIAKSPFFAAYAAIFRMNTAMLASAIKQHVPLRRQLPRQEIPEEDWDAELKKPLR